MAGSFRMYKHLWVEKAPVERDLQLVWKWLLSDFHSLKELDDAEPISPIDERHVQLSKIPSDPIVKLAKAEHVDAFFRKGTLQLGSFDYYSNHDHSEVRDPYEGLVSAVGVTNWGYFAGTYGYGYANYVFCTYIGNPDSETRLKFGYDSGFVIHDPIEFSNSIKRALGSDSAQYGQCVYSPFKAIIGFDANHVDRSRISHETAQIVRTGKYFIKPESFSHQREFRFLWEVPHNVNGAQLIECPEAIQFCTRID